MSNATQSDLWHRTSTPRAARVKAEQRDYDKGNADAARAILAAPFRFGGPDAFPCVWARCFRVRQANQARVKRTMAAT